MPSSDGSGTPLKFVVTVTQTIEVTVNNPSALSRAVDNEDGFREHYYDFSTADEVARHLAYNYAANGVDDVARLDGWADLDASAVAFRLLWNETEVEA